MNRDIAVGCVLQHGREHLGRLGCKVRRLLRATQDMVRKHSLDEVDVVRE